MISFTVPGEAPSTPNLREHWATKARRTKAQRAKVARLMPKWLDGPLLVIRLTRVAPRELDTDNLAAALKGHRDAVAAKLRIDDATPLVRWEYEQFKGAPAVHVQIMTRDEARSSRIDIQDPATAQSGLRLRASVEGSHKLGTNSAPDANAILQAFDVEARRRIGDKAARQAEETFAPGVVHFRGMSGACMCGAARHENCR